MAEQPGVAFADLLRQLRTEAKLTQEELAEAAGLSPRSVSDLERGVHRTARKHTALLLAGALGLAGSAEELFVAAARGKAQASQVLSADRGGAPGLRGAVPGSPYRGLAAYEERDAALFFGREAATSQVLERMSRLLAGTGLLVVSGVSGAGKSSLLRAGVLARIRGGGLAAAPGAALWPRVLLTPTRAPLDELALRVAALAGADAAAVRRGLEADPARFALTARQATLAQPHGQTGDANGAAAGPGQPSRQRRLLLVVDQFEELFTHCADEGQRRAFITALHAAGSAGHGPDQTPAALVVLGVRADFEARCADYPHLTGPVQDRYLVTSMTERQLRMAIAEPAKKAGSGVDDDLVGVLLTEVRNGQPGTFGAGVLPLLSHALDQAWRCRTGEAVTLAEYERAGGIEGAVASSAQRAFARLTPAQQDAAQRVFLRLTATSPDGVDTADRVTRAELTEGESASQAQDVEAVLETFAAERLLTLAAGTVEISHESLLTAWPLLRDTWLADTHADRIVRTRLRATAAEWARHSRDPSYLYSGSLLQAAAGAAARVRADHGRHPPLSQTEQDFLNASGRAHRRRARRRRGFLAFLVALVVGFASLALLAVRASQQAARQRDIAISARLIIQSQILGDHNPALARLLSVAAWNINPSSDARYAMLAAAALPGITVLTGPAWPVLSVAFSPDGKTVADSSADGTVRFWDTVTGRQVASLPASPTDGLVLSVAFSPDGKILAAAGDDGTVLWDVAARRRLGGRLGLDVNSVAFSRDGATLATGGNDGTVRLWEVATRRQIGAPLTSPRRFVNSVAFSPDGTTLATGSDDGTVRLWDAATHRQIGTTLTSPSGFVSSVAFSGDSRTLATGGYHGTVLWDVAAHRQIGAPLASPGGHVNSVAFSPADGTILVTGSDDGTVRLWDVTTHRQIGAPLTGPGGGISSVAFSGDGKTLASGNTDGAVRLWGVTSGEIGGPLTGHTDQVNSVAFSPDGKTVASGSSDSTARLWDAATRRQIAKPFTGDKDGVYSVAFSPDGKILASSSGTGSVRLWNVTTRSQVGGPLTGHTGTVYSVAFSPDGKILASGTVAGPVRLWNVATRSQVGGPLTGHTGTVESVAFSPKRKTLASGSGDGTVRLWDADTHRKIGKLVISPTSDVTSVAFSPHGETLAAGDHDGAIELWDASRQRQITTLAGSAGPVLSVVFSPDGETLAAGDGDGAIELWDVSTQREITTLVGSGGPVSSVAFSPDGKTLASGSFDHTIRLWDVAYLLDVVPHLCASAGRPLTRAEWARYVPGLAYQKVCS